MSGDFFDVYIEYVRLIELFTLGFHGLRGIRSVVIGGESVIYFSLHYEELDMAISLSNLLSESGKRGWPVKKIEVLRTLKG